MNNATYYSRNRERELAKVKKWNLNNKDKINQWRRSHRQRKKLLTFSYKLRCKYKTLILPFDLWKILKKQKMKCALSGRKLTNENISLDHIIPLHNGGLTEIKNPRFVTHDANKAKGILSDTELVSLCQDIIQNLDMRLGCGIM